MARMDVETGNISRVQPRKKFEEYTIGELKTVLEKVSEVEQPEHWSEIRQENCIIGEENEKKRPIKYQELISLAIQREWYSGEEVEEQMEDQCWISQ